MKRLIILMVLSIAGATLGISNEVNVQVGNFETISTGDCMYTTGTCYGIPPKMLMEQGQW